MITLQVVSIDQRYDLATGQVQNFAVLRFASGKEIKAAIDLDTTTQLLEEAAEDRFNGEQDEAAPSEAVATEWQGPTDNGVEVDAGDGNTNDADDSVDWMALPDDLLSPNMKAAFHHLGVMRRMGLPSIQSLAEQVSERFSSEEWQEVLGGAKIVEAAAVPTVGQMTPTVGQVTWTDGSPILPSSKRSRSVAMDDYGYPLVASDERDPGEVVGGVDVDEDGIGQL